MNIKSVIVACDATARKAIASVNPQLTIHDASTLPSLLAAAELTLVGVACQEHRSDLHRTLELCFLSFGPSGLVQMINPEPNAYLQSIAYEYGFDHFLPYEDLGQNLDRACLWAASRFGDDANSAAFIASGFKSIRSLGQKDILASAERLRPFASYDFAAAYAFGKHQEALGAFAEAELAYRRSLELNHTFRPASMALAECLLVLSKSDESLKILSELEQADDTCLVRKALLAATYAERKNLDEANRYADESAKLSALDPRSLEAKAHVFFASGSVEEALGVMTSLKNVGPFFTAKLNELGISLSQGGKGAVALTLYEKAHGIVRPELKFKISLNAALAAHRAGDGAKAMELLSRCEKEYGGTFAKLEKIRGVVLQTVDASRAAS